MYLKLIKSSLVFIQFVEKLTHLLFDIDIISTMEYKYSIKYQIGTYSSLEPHIVNIFG